jgi:hypothetical protein
MNTGATRGTVPAVPEGCDCVEDDAGHRLPYLLRPAADPASARTLVVLHGRGANVQPAKFASEDWNVLCPLDCYGRGGRGSWWLGEGGDFFVARMLHRLVRSVRRQLGGDRGLYFWGSSMGGYGAILHGTVLRAHAVYAHIPQIRLRGTDYTDGRNKPLYDAVLGERARHPYIDLGAFVAKRRPSEVPLFFLNQNRFDYKLYLEQHCLHFIEACNRSGHAYGLNIDPYPGHRLYRKIAEGVARFDEFDREIQRWRARARRRETADA